MESGQTDGGGTQSGAVRKSGGCEEAAENGKLTSTSFSVKRIISPWSINFRSGLRCAAKGDESETGRRGVLGSNWAELHASMRVQQLTGYPAGFEMRLLSSFAAMEAETIG